MQETKSGKYTKPRMSLVTSTPTNSEDDVFGSRFRWVKVRNDAPDARHLKRLTRTIVAKAGNFTTDSTNEKNCLPHEVSGLVHETIMLL